MVRTGKFLPKVLMEQGFFPLPRFLKKKENCDRKDISIAEYFEGYADEKDLFLVNVLWKMPTERTCVLANALKKMLTRLRGIFFNESRINRLSISNE